MRTVLGVQLLVYREPWWRTATDVVQAVGTVGVGAALAWLTYRQGRTSIKVRANGLHLNTPYNFVTVVNDGATDVNLLTIELTMKRSRRRRANALRLAEYGANQLPDPLIGEAPRLRAKDSVTFKFDGVDDVNWRVEEVRSHPENRWRTEHKPRYRWRVVTASGEQAYSPPLKYTSDVHGPPWYQGWSRWAVFKDRWRRRITWRDPPAK